MRAMSSAHLFYPVAGCRARGPGALAAYRVVGFAWRGRRAGYGPAGTFIHRCAATEQSRGYRQARGRTVVECAGMPQVGAAKQDDRPCGRHELYLGRMRAHLAAEGQRVGRVPVDRCEPGMTRSGPLSGVKALMHHMADRLRHRLRFRWPGK
jgi:hypothetical protein